MIVKSCMDLLKENSKDGLPKEIFVSIHFHRDIEALVKRSVPHAPMLLVTVWGVPFYVDPSLTEKFRIVR